MLYVAALNYNLSFFLTQCHIQHHHQGEADSEENRTDVGMFALGHFRDQLLHDHIQHSTGGEGQQVGKNGDENVG